MGGETDCPATSEIGFRGLSPRGRGNPYQILGAAGWMGSIPAWAGKPESPLPEASSHAVYPRVGGETPIVRVPAILVMGLSPRGRGNRTPGNPGVDLLRSIPAWAGKPTDPAILAGLRGVYPRVGGETRSNVLSDDVSDGLSPRGRGNPRRRLPAASVSRSIPAWAGKPSTASSSARTNGVYPRVGGETASAHVRPMRRDGLSPRGRGNRERLPTLP